jgi:hypothetical protein
MKKYFKFWFIVFFIPLILVSKTDTQHKAKYTFRKTLWGMTKESVKISEKKEPALDQEATLAYQDTLIGLNMGVYYYFVNNKLVRSGYGIIEKHSNRNLYIKDYDKIKEALIEKYGDPSDKWVNGKKYKEIVWLNDLYKDDPSHWGLAISIGHLAYQLIWITEETEIYLHLTGDNYEIQLLVSYISRELKDLEEKKDKEEKLKKF